MLDENRFTINILYPFIALRLFRIWFQAIVSSYKFPSSTNCTVLRHGIGKTLFRLTLQQRDMPTESYQKRPQQPVENKNSCPLLQWKNFSNFFTRGNRKFGYLTQFKLKTVICRIISSVVWFPIKLCIQSKKISSWLCRSSFHSLEATNIFVNDLFSS